MSEASMPAAVWQGEIMGVKVYVLDDGRRIVDAEDMNRLFARMSDPDDDFDSDAFGAKIAAFIQGQQ